MSKCLVTKLKAVVNDDSLRKLGELKIGRSGGGNNTDDALMYVYMTQEGRAVLTKGNWFGGSGAPEKPIRANKQVQLNRTDGSVVEIFDRYYIREMYVSNAKVNLEDFTYMLNLEKITMYTSSDDIIGNINVFADMPKLNSVDLRGKGVEGDISVFGAYTALTSIILTNTNVDGDIASIGRLTNIVKLSLAECNVSGRIEDFVAAQVAAGRTSGEIIMPYVMAARKITYNEISLSQLGLVSSGTNKLSWNGTNITWS